MLTDCTGCPQQQIRAEIGKSCCVFRGRPLVNCPDRPPACAAHSCHHSLRSCHHFQRRDCLTKPWPLWQQKQNLSLPLPCNSQTDPMLPTPGQLHTGDIDPAQTIGPYTAQPWTAGTLAGLPQRSHLRATCARGRCPSLSVTDCGTRLPKVCRQGSTRVSTWWAESLGLGAACWLTHLCVADASNSGVDLCLELWPYWLLLPV